MWREEVTSQPLTIGYFTSPGLVPPASGCVRAVLEAKQRLERAGHKVIEFPAPDIRKVMYFFNGMVLADGNKFMFQNLSWDPNDKICICSLLLTYQFSPQKCIFYQENILVFDTWYYQ